MSFRVATRQSGAVTIIDLSGSVTHSDAGALHEMLDELIKKGQKRVLLNLEEVGHLDSSGISALVQAYKSIKNSGGQFKVLHLNRQVQRILEITNLSHVLEDYSDENAALHSFL
ncbi:MAG: STAS domain-containing protein [Candidatus Acidiferrales bacterium]|jgi:anti-sigma B factor antagonist